MYAKANSAPSILHFSAFMFGYNYSGYHVIFEACHMQDLM